MNIKTKLSAAGILSLSIAQVVHAQSQPAEQSYAIEEVTVTAQKRAQSTQDLGLAITALGGEQMREQGIEDGTDLAAVIPNVSMQNIGGGGLPVVIVRGIGLQNFRVNDSPTTSFYVDEVYQTSIAAVEFSMFDMERVEVLKGPQGGLYGRNTIGGAVQVISAKPVVGEEANGFTSLSFGEYGQTNGEFGASLPVNDTMAVRVSGRIEQSDDKYWTDTVTGKKHGEEDRWATRAILAWEPTDTIDATFKIHGGADQSELALQRAVGIYAGNLGPFTPFSGLCASILAGNGTSADCVTLSGQTTSELGQDGNIYAAANGSQVLPAMDSNWMGASAVVNFQLSDAYTLTSVTAHDSLDYARNVNSDAIPIEFQNIAYGTEIDWWSQEFRLAYDNGGDLTWIAGANYSEDELSEASVLRGGEGILPAAFGGASYSNQYYDQNAESYAIYGHAEYALNDRWSTTGELRYTNETRSFSGIQQFMLPDDSQLLAITVDDSAEFSNVSGKVGVNFAANDNVLLFGSVSNGFKVGGFFGGFATDPSQLAAYDEETILAYEAGIKSDWLDGRLRANAALFIYEREDVQMGAREDLGEGVVSPKRLVNIGDVETHGAEVDFTWLPTENLTLNAAFGYTDAEIADSDYVNRSSLEIVGNLEGANIPNYSKYSSNLTGRYEHEIGANLLGHVQLEYSYRSERDLDLITTPEIEEAVFQEPSYSLLNLRLGLGDAEGGWGLSANIENLLDEEYRAEARGDGLYGVYEIYGAPRTWSLSANYSW
ncbi:TonB-dependent receptor [Microbulbifer agarilyticus]